MGKPEEFMLANIAETFKLERSQICMVGDRLDTDILFGQDGGLTTMLVLSGKQCIQKFNQGILHFVKQLHSLLSFLSQWNARFATRYTLK